MKTILSIGLLVVLAAALPAQAALIKTERHGPSFDMADLTAQAFQDQMHIDWSHFLPEPAQQSRPSHQWLAKLPLKHRNAGHSPAIETPRIETTPTSVWEPPVFGLMALGLLCMAGARRRIQKMEALS